MRTLCQRLIDAPAFQRSVLGLIVLARLLVGLETHAGLVAHFGGLLHAMDCGVLALFVVELLVRIGACGAQP